MKAPRLVAQARPGVHEVKVFNCHIKKSGYVKVTDIYRVSKFQYARVRKAIVQPPIIEHPSQEEFLTAVFMLAHDRLHGQNI